jgi:hypothetical protein
MHDANESAMRQSFYIQDSRCYVGNDVLWWAKGGKGYTTDVSKAEVYTEEDAQKMHNSRHTDIPWPKDYIDAKTRPAVDMQFIKRTEALANTGISLAEPVKQKKQTCRCHACGVFQSENARYLGNCSKCGADNRP